jgi:predicted histone-like DNA-binding protein
MSIPYTVVSKRPAGIAGTNSPRYYPVLTERSTIDLRAVCDIISQRSTFSHADVVGVVHALIELVPELLMDGKNVKLDDWGTFSVHASGVGQDVPEKVTSRDITSLKMTFLPDKNIKQKLQRSTYVKVKKR